MPFRPLLAALLFLSSALAAEPLRVGLSPDYPPLAFRSESRIVGLEADNARAVGEILSREVSLVPLPFEQLIPALLAGQIDVIMSGLSVTAGRSQQVRFAEPYLRVGQMAILHQDKVLRFGQPWAIYQPGVRIGVESGTTGAAFAERELPDAALAFFADPDSAFTALREDRIDLYIHDAPTSWGLATSSENSDLISLYRPLTEEQLAWAVAPGDSTLLADLDRALVLMRGAGTLDYIINRWIPVEVTVQ
ncbi:transporter substrate-binding domain-containing protein [Pseudohaliea rubra]|uniref:Amino acid ABC transporter, periplasmic amino acid-binding protein n=1 Tax=Pseudohaliea rubra DSM 19751 TaxID=1265313 RepID=A0A095VUF4_9GAMM|nr:transporter substrate-binding domain-containing protein [Pseudohaliea rubra]KGE04678.1 amino acid ABC transporter, periplasmic amino acid-binding protein [Pseudohaliea rubra DSM 19751]